MKTLLQFALMLVLVSANAQEGYISVGVDGRNVIDGSKATDGHAEFNFNFKAAAVGQDIEGGIGYELFKRINYDRMYFFIGYQIEITEKIKVVPTLEPSLINRWGTWGGALIHNSPSSHYTLGLSAPVRYSVSDSFSVEWIPSLLPRTDNKAKFGGEGLKFLDTPIVFSNFLGVVFKF